MHNEVDESAASIAERTVGWRHDVFRACNGRLGAVGGGVGFHLAERRHRGSVGAGFRSALRVEGCVDAEQREGVALHLLVRVDDGAAQRGDEARVQHAVADGVGAAGAATAGGAARKVARRQAGAHRRRVRQRVQLAQRLFGGL